MFVWSVVGAMLMVSCIALLAWAGDTDPFAGLSKGAAYIMVGAAIMASVFIVLALIVGAERATKRRFRR